MSEKNGPAVYQPSLAQETWTPTAPSAIVLSLLRSEWDKWPQATAFADRRLVTAADISDPVQNNVRLGLLWQIRAGLLVHIPADTEWFEVKCLRRCHFHQLRTVHHMDFTSGHDQNELERVAEWKQLPLGPLDVFEPVLWGHERDGPLTILEGNHRLVALAKSEEPHALELTAYIGISPSACLWHLPDVQE